MGPEVIIATLVPLSFFGLIFGIVYIRNRENMALIERGMNPRMKDARPSPFINLKYGLLMIGCGTGLLAAYLIDTLIFKHHMMLANGSVIVHDSDNPALYFALIGIGGGLGLYNSYRIEKREWLDKKKDN